MLMADKPIKPVKGMTHVEVVCYHCGKSFMGWGTRTFCGQLCQREDMRSRDLEGRKSKTKPTMPNR